MYRTGILNPDILHLLARVRHTNRLVIADRGFPYWPEVETVDISLVDGVPSVLQVLNALRGNFDIGQAYMAAEFRVENTPKLRHFLPPRCRTSRSASRRTLTSNCTSPARSG